MAIFLSWIALCFAGAGGARAFFYRAEGGRFAALRLILS